MTKTTNTLIKLPSEGKPATDQKVPDKKGALSHTDHKYSAFLPDGQAKRPLFRKKLPVFTNILTSLLITAGAAFKQIVGDIRDR